METKTRKAYSAEYKKEAVELVNQPGQTVAGVARDLGIRPGLLGRWRREQADLGKKAFVGQGVARDQELMQLRRELAQVKKERDFLKSAAAYFASDAK
jgi:transposase